MRRRVPAILMGIYLAVFLGLTLGGFYQANPQRNFVPFRTIEHDLRRGGVEFVVNFLGNLAAGWPMGWLLPGLLGKRCTITKVAGASMAISLAIEILQGISGRRVADVDDVILNTVGGLLGYGSWWIWHRRSRSTAL